MGKGSEQNTTQHSTTTSSIDPRYNNAAWDNYNQAMDVARNYSPAVIPTPLNFNQDQLSSQNMIRNMTGAGNPASPYLNDASTMTRAGVGVATGYRPQQITAPTIDPSQIPQISASLANRGSIRDINAPTTQAAQMTQDQLNNYLSMQDPAYTNAVMDATMNDLNRARQMSQVSNGAAAAQAGAFGGTRQAVMDAETNRGFADAVGRTAADLNMQRFMNAQNNLQTDLNRRQNTGQFNAANAMTAAQANQAADQNVALQNASLGTNANIANAQNHSNFALANANMNMAAQQANQDAAYRAANLGFTANMAGADQLARLGDTARNYAVSDANLLGQVGQQNYDLNAAMQNVAYQNAQNQSQVPLQRLALQQMALGSVPYGTTTTSDGTSSTSYQPGLGSQIMSGLGSAMMLGGMFASDKRLKKNIKPLSGTPALDAIHKLEPVSYQWKHNGSHDLGFTAQNVQSVLPHAVQELNGVKHISLPGVVGLLTKSVQELHRKVEPKRVRPRVRKVAA